MSVSLRAALLCPDWGRHTQFWVFLTLLISLLLTLVGIGCQETSMPFLLCYTLNFKSVPLASYLRGFLTYRTGIRHVLLPMRAAYFGRFLFIGLNSVKTCLESLMKALCLGSSFKEKMVWVYFVFSIFTHCFQLRLLS